MPDLVILKLVHQASAGLSIVGFVVRAVLVFSRSALMHRRWMRVWPHFIDTALLVTGVWMAVLLHLHPGNSSWLGAKLAALVVYILLGFVALRLGRNQLTKGIAFVGALATFAYILAVAVTRNPLPF